MNRSKGRAASVLLTIALIVFTLAILFAVFVILNENDHIFYSSEFSVPVESLISESDAVGVLPPETTAPTTVSTATEPTAETFPGAEMPTAHEPVSTDVTNVTNVTEGSEPTVVPLKNPDHTAYLTFDDGPSDNTRKILDILDRYGVKATFFVIHHNGCDDIYKDIVARGHTIALHSWSHEYDEIYCSEEAYFADLDRIGGYVEQLVGFRPTVIRFPGGSSNTVSRHYCDGIMTTLAASVEARGYRYFDWNLSSGDATANRVSKSSIVKNVRNNIPKDGRSVTVLMHDTNAKSTTVEALPEIIDLLLQNGYTILPIDDTTVPVHMTIAN